MTIPGHDPAILYNAGKGVFEELQGESIPLGADGSWVYAQNTKAGSLKEQIILIGTDGIWEASNPDGEMFGKNRLQGLIRQNASGSAKAIMQAIFLSSAGQRRERSCLSWVLKFSYPPN